MKGVDRHVVFDPRDLGGGFAFIFNSWKLWQHSITNKLTEELWG